MTRLLTGGLSDISAERKRAHVFSCSVLGLLLVSRHVPVEKSESHAPDPRLEDTMAPDFCVGTLGWSLLRAWPQGPIPDRKEERCQGSVQT